MPKIIADTQIFRAVIKVISERGYAGATTRQIAEAAGVSEVTLFRKFGSKAELVKRTIKALVEQTEFESAIHYSGDIGADLLRVLQAYREAVILHEHFFFVLYAELSRTPELADFLSQPLGLFRAIGGLLARYQSAGLLKPEYPLHSAASLLGPLIYYSMITHSVEAVSMPPIELETLIHHFLDGRYVSKQASPSG